MRGEPVLQNKLGSRDSWTKLFLLAIATMAMACGSRAMTLTVTNTLDSGSGSLRQAILDANANLGPDLITFQIPGPGTQMIVPLSALPAITDPVSIDGSTQPGFAGTPLIELRGTSAGGNAGL